MDFENGHFFVGEATELDAETVKLLTHSLNNFVANSPAGTSFALLTANGYKVEMTRADGVVRVWDSLIVHRPRPEPAFYDGFFFLTFEREMLACNRKIPAIKSIRTRMKIGLLEAKCHADAFEEKYGINNVNGRQPCPHTAYHVRNGVCCRCGFVGLPPNV